MLPALLSQDAQQQILAGRRLLASSQAYRRRVRSLVIGSMTSSPAPRSPSGAAPSLHTSMVLSNTPEEPLGLTAAGGGPQQVQGCTSVLSGAASAIDTSMAMDNGLETCVKAASGLTNAAIATSVGNERR